MGRDKKLLVIDIICSVFILFIVIATICNKGFSSMIDGFFLPEERNKGYYDLLNSPLKMYESRELYENGTKNLLANYLRSGDRDSGYSITVNSDGTFVFSGTYTGGNNTYEGITPIGVGFDLPTGDYVFSDGGASSQDSVSIKLTGARRIIGGGTEYVNIAALPGDASFHWDKDSNLEIYCEIVIRPGASANGLKFSPMLLKEEDAIDQYMPCLTPDYDWENEGETENSAFDKYDVYKGTLDGEVVTKADWEIFTNRIRYQMQEDRAVIDLKDGTGIEINKKDFPAAIYGKLNASKMITDGHEINLTDYNEVMDSIKSDFGDISSTELKSIRDFYTYLKALYHENYTVLISVKDEGVNALSNGSYSLLQKLGVISDLMEKENNDIRRKKNYQNSFLCVLRQGKADVEKLGEQKLKSEGGLTDGAVYSIESSGQKTGEVKASILIDGTEYAMNMRGMNIVIYDEKKHEVIDSVCFDTYSGLFCHRQAG